MPDKAAWVKYGYFIEVTSLSDIRHWFYIGLFWENMKKSCFISIPCQVLLEVLSDPSSKLFGGLDDAFA